jgi:hypothetical protein
MPVVKSEIHSTALEARWRVGFVYPDKVIIKGPAAKISSEMAAG